MLFIDEEEVGEVFKKLASLPPFIPHFISTRTTSSQASSGYNIRTHTQ